METTMSQVVHEEKLCVNHIKAAKAFDLSTATIRKLTHLKKIPFIKIGRAVRYNLAELEKFFSERSK
jgi:excisionase family DNA binding protein